MADPKHVARVQRGVREWNAWRRRSPRVIPDLSRAWLVDLDLRGINFSSANLERANLRQAVLSGANLSNANVRQADLRAASLRRARLDEADLTGAILRFASLAEVRVEGAVLDGCEIYGVSVWNVVGTPRVQSNLAIRATARDAAVVVDDLELAQFVFLLLKNEKIRNVIDTVGRKAVLLLGRFSAERKALLDRLRDALRERGYVPMLFDFQKSAQRDLTETIVTLAHLSRFVIADLSDPKSVPQELGAIIPNLPSVPIVPIVDAAQTPYSMFEHWQRYAWVLPLVRYRDAEHLVRSLDRSIVRRAEKKARGQTGV